MMQKTLFGESIPIIHNDCRKCDHFDEKEMTCKITNDEVINPEIACIRWIPISEEKTKEKKRSEHWRSIEEIEKEIDDVKKDIHILDSKAGNAQDSIEYWQCELMDINDRIDEQLEILKDLKEELAELE